MRPLASLAFVLAACAATLSDEQLMQKDREVSDANTQREASALAAWRTGHPGVTEAKSSDVQLPGQRSELALDPASGHVVFQPETCIDGDSCRCTLSQRYVLFAEPNGHIDVVRLRPVPKVEVVHLKSCVTGCGQPSPRPPPVQLDLGVGAMTDVTVVDVPYAYTKLQEVCDHETHAP
jgi:hypothetical protein